MSQLNTVNNTDTVIDLNLNTNHLIDQPFSMDQQGIVSATGNFYYGIIEGEISTPIKLFWPSSSLACGMTSSYSWSHCNVYTRILRHDSTVMIRPVMIGH